MGEYANVTFEVDQRVGLLTLNRPSRRNALSLPLMGEFEDVLARVDGNRDLRSLVVTGAGDSFCVGADLHGPDTLPDSIVEDRDGQTVSGFREPAGRVTERIFRLRIPVIGAVNGDAVGGGATILAGMDYRVAADDARFGFVFTRRGVSPEGASTWFVPRLVGAGRATDWLLSGRIFDAAEALDAGFVARIVPKAEVLDAALEYASIFSTLT